MLRSQFRCATCRPPYVCDTDVTGGDFVNVGQQVDVTVDQKVCDVNLGETVLQKVKATTRLPVDVSVT